MTCPIPRGTGAVSSTQPRPAGPVAVTAQGMAAEAIGLMLAMKGQAGDRIAAPDRVLPPETVFDPLVVMADLAIADLSDPEVIRAESGRLTMAASAASHLGEAMAATNARDLDLAIHHLRAVLIRIDRQSGFNVSPNLRDAALAPVLWRMAALDHGFGSYLCIGLDRLARRAGLLLARHDGGRILGAAAAQRLVASLREAGAYIARADSRSGWSRALGPAGWN